MCWLKIATCRPFPAFPSNLFIRWRLQDTTGTTAVDCSVNGTHSGTYMGGITKGYSGRGFGNAAAVAAKADGSTGYVLLPTIPGVQSGGPFGASGYSIEAWVYITGWSNTNYRIFTAQSAGAAGSFYDLIDFGLVRSFTTEVD